MIYNPHAYSFPGTGSVTLILVNVQCPIPLFLTSPTAPHCTGNTAASISSLGGWHAADIVALQLLASGIPAGNFLNAVATPPNTMQLPTIVVRIMATGEYLQVEMERSGSTSPASLMTLICTMKMLCDASQCSSPEATVSGMAYVNGSCSQ